MMQLFLKQRRETQIMINHEMGALLFYRKKRINGKNLHNFQSFGSETRYFSLKK